MRIPSLAANLAVFVGAVLAVNALIAGLHFPGATGAPGGLPGWFVGLVWTLLFALFGTAHWKLQAAASWTVERRCLMAFSMLCLIYPFYTLGLSDLAIGLAGNIVTVCAALLLVRRLGTVSSSTALLVAPVVPWLVFASWTIVLAL